MTNETKEEKLINIREANLEEIQRQGEFQYYSNRFQQLSEKIYQNRESINLTRCNLKTALNRLSICNFVASSGLLALGIGQVINVRSTDYKMEEIRKELDSSNTNMGEQINSDHRFRMKNTNSIEKLEEKLEQEKQKNLNNQQYIISVEGKLETEKEQIAKNRLEDLKKLNDEKSKLLKEMEDLKKENNRIINEIKAKYEKDKQQLFIENENYRKQHEKAGTQQGRNFEGLAHQLNSDYRRDMDEVSQYLYRSMLEMASRIPFAYSQANNQPQGTPIVVQKVDPSRPPKKGGRDIGANPYFIRDILAGNIGGGFAS